LSVGEIVDKIQEDVHWFMALLEHIRNMFRFLDCKKRIDWFFGINPSTMTNITQAQRNSFFKEVPKSLAKCMGTCSRNAQKRKDNIASILAQRRATRAAYLKSATGKAVRKKSAAKYRKSDNYKKYREAYNQRDDVKKRRENYAKSDRGKASARRYRESKKALKEATALQALAPYV